MHLLKTHDILSKCQFVLPYIPSNESNCLITLVNSKNLSRQVEWTRYGYDSAGLVSKVITTHVQRRLTATNTSRTEKSQFLNEREIMATKSVPRPEIHGTLIIRLGQIPEECKRLYRPGPDSGRVQTSAPAWARFRKSANVCTGLGQIPEECKRPYRPSHQWVSRLRNRVTDLFCKEEK